MSRRGSVRVIDRGYDRLLRIAKKLQGASVTVGIHANKGGEPHSAPARGAAGVVRVAVVDVAIWNEFGMGVPERPFLRGWFDATSRQNGETMKTLAQSAIKGTRTIEQALEVCGARLVGELQQRIARGEGVLPNSPKTIYLKGSSVPLVDTGQMRASLTYRVTIRG